MWKCEEFLNFISTILQSDFVEEFILINNDVQNTPELPNNKKLVVLNFEENIGVNKAWNIGVLRSKSDLLAIINDDVQFNTKILDILSEIITDQFGMIGTNLYSGKGDVFIRPTESRYFGYACVFFIHKNSYHMIPNELKIYFGDDWLFNINKFKGKSNMLIDGLDCKHSLDSVGGKTSRNFINCIIEEREFYNNLIKQYVI